VEAECELDSESVLVMQMPHAMHILTKKKVVTIRLRNVICKNLNQEFVSVTTRELNVLCVIE